MEEHYWEFTLELSLSDTIETEEGTSEEALETIKSDAKKELIYQIKDFLRSHTTYEVDIL